VSSVPVYWICHDVPRVGFQYDGAAVGLGAGAGLLALGDGLAAGAGAGEGDGDGDGEGDGDGDGTGAGVEVAVGVGFGRLGPAALAGPDRTGRTASAAATMTLTPAMAARVRLATVSSRSAVAWSSTWCRAVLSTSRHFTRSPAGRVRREFTAAAGRYRPGMRTVGLTGGIGSGKSEVSRLLRSYGAEVVDADLLAREVVDVGTPGLRSVVDAFGDELIQADGSLDRAALGRCVFSDPDALARLNAILHPLIAERTAERFRQAAARGTDVLVHDVALLVENGLADNYDAVAVVAVDPATQLDRLVRLRGMSPEDARARIDAQAPLAAKLAVATHVLNNDGPIEALVPQVERLWASLTRSATSDIGDAAGP
jgi:dephospho-CoA kinase